ncbi:MAG TPA: T9SS type A sorting domain-containing protein [Bacteroidia bacterium]|nr:T9SS type A sorting domain-containing protein [Bacteroidia bacterium]
MKKLYTNCCSVFLLLFVSNFSFSQNWQPLSIGWKYNYKLDNLNVVANTVWIDSSNVMGSDSIFYLNRIVMHCDTCTAALGGSNPCDSCYALKNQPHFLQREVLKLADGNFYFNDTSKIVLNSFAALNDTWLFDSVANITAQIISTALSTVFGINDSVKTILLSSGDTINFSKNYGILQFPNLYGQNSYYRLAGIEGPNLGEQVPGFRQIFDFNVGDIFHYVGEYIDGSAMPPVQIYYDKQYTIAAKNIYNDSLSYNYQGLIWGYNFGVGYFSSPLNLNVMLYDSAEHFSNSFNTQFLNTNSRLMGNFGEHLFYFDSIYDFTQFSMDSNGIFTKSFGNENFSFNNFTLVNPQEDLLNTVDIFTVNWWLWSSYLKYKTGLGQTDYGYGYFEHTGEEHLVGYVKNGDTTGVISSMNPIFDPIPFFSVYPNPASELINVHFMDGDAGKIWLTDMTGKKIFEKNFNSHLQIDTRSFASGIYILSVNSKQMNVKRKIVISKE